MLRLITKNLKKSKNKKKLKVSGTAEIVEREGGYGPGLYIEITPRKKIKLWY